MYVFYAFIIAFIQTLTLQIGRLMTFMLSPRCQFDDRTFLLSYIQGELRGREILRTVLSTNSEVVSTSGQTEEYYCKFKCFYSDIYKIQDNPQFCKHKLKISEYLWMKKRVIILTRDLELLGIHGQRNTQNCVNCKLKLDEYYRKTEKYLS